jgi:hypothetical protein
VRCSPRLVCAHLNLHLALLHNHGKGLDRLFGLEIPLFQLGISRQLTRLRELQWNDDYSRDHWWASRPRADAQVNLMEPFMNLLSDFRCLARSVNSFIRSWLGMILG